MQSDGTTPPLKAAKRPGEARIHPMDVRRGLVGGVADVAVSVGPGRCCPPCPLRHALHFKPSFA
jgi:hypothetical protein